ELDAVGLTPTRPALVGVLGRFGARVAVEIAPDEADEPRGTIIVEGDRTGGVEIGPNLVPLLIDVLPAIAALAAHGGRVDVRGAGELRVKESDRIAVLVAGFRALGIDAEERPDGFTIDGASRGARPKGGVADAGGISYPGFFETLGRLVRPSTGLGAPGAESNGVEGGQGLSGRLHGRRQDDGGEGAREAARLAGGGHRRADREPRAPAGRRDLRHARRAVLPHRRAAGARRAVAAAASGGRHRRRHVRRRAESG